MATRRKNNPLGVFYHATEHHRAAWLEAGDQGYSVSSHLCHMPAGLFRHRTGTTSPPSPPYGKLAIPEGYLRAHRLRGGQAAAETRAEKGRSGAERPVGRSSPSLLSSRRLPAPAGGTSGRWLLPPPLAAPRLWQPGSMAAVETRVCETAGCSSEAKLQCPTCLKLGIQGSYFCSQVRPLGSAPSSPVGDARLSSSRCGPGFDPRPAVPGITVLPALGPPFVPTESSSARCGTSWSPGGAGPAATGGAVTPRDWGNAGLGCCRTDGAVVRGARLVLGLKVWVVVGCVSIKNKGLVGQNETGSSNSSVCVSVPASALSLELLGFDKLVALKTDSPFSLNTSFWENYSVLFRFFMPLDMLL